MKYDSSRIFNRAINTKHYDAIRKVYLKEKIKNPQCIAEVGVAIGGFTRTIRELWPEAELHLFDLWNKTLRCEKDILVDNQLLIENNYYDDLYQKDAAGHAMFYLNPDYTYLRSLFISEAGKTFPYKGDVCETTANVPEDKMFDLIFVNVNAYRPTLHALDFFYEHLTDNGRMYLANSDSIFVTKKALNDFHARHPEANVRYIEGIEWDLITKW